MAKQGARPAVPPRLRERLRACRARVREMGVEALLVTDPRDVRYLTGFSGEDSWLLVRSRAQRPHLLSDARFAEQIEREAPHVAAVIRDGSMGDALEKLLGRLRVETVGLPAGSVTLAQQRALKRKLGARRPRAVDDGLLWQRAHKDEAEIRAIRRAIRVQEAAYERALARIEPGMRERELAALIEYEMRVGGAEARSFPTIVAVAGHASQPHAEPGGRRVREGAGLLIDWGARVNGYCGDLTRVVALGRMPDRLRRVYDVVLEAQRAAIDAIAPGRSLYDVDRAARGVIEAAGYGDRFGHGLGHGIGMAVHEQPVLSPRAEGELAPGHVVTVEPGVYLPGRLGVRIEDDVAVTQRGRRVLSRLPTDPDSAII